jgi:EmrB/QacA subfamily drug resistance transporter
VLRRDATEPEAANKWAVLGIVATGVFMATLDTSVVNISLPSIARHFGRAFSAGVQWVVIAYLVVIAAVLLTIGRLSDIVGRKRIWAAGIALFTVGSALCGAAPSLGLLIACRAVQGVGGAMIMAISPAMLTAAFPPEERGRAIGFNAVFVALGVSAGPTLGGLITEHLSWRWIFYVNLPVGVAGLLATLAVLPRESSPGRGRFDLAGATFLGVGLASVTGALSLGGEHGWSSRVVIGAFAVAGAAFATFAVVERRARHRLVDYSLFKDRVFASATASLVLSFLAMFAVAFMMPFYLEELRRFSPARSGTFLTPLPLTLAVAAPLAGTIADRFGTRWLAFAGLAMCALSLFLIGTLDASSSGAGIAGRMALAGLGQGLFQTPNNSALLGAAPRDRQGLASGILATGRVVGQSLSVALAGAVWVGTGGARAGRALMTGTAVDVGAVRRVFESSFRVTLWMCAVIAAVGAVVSLTRGRERARADASSSTARSTGEHAGAQSLA